MISLIQAVQVVDEANRIRSQIASFILAPTAPDPRFGSSAFALASQKVRADCAGDSKGNYTIIRIVRKVNVTHGVVLLKLGRRGTLIRVNDKIVCLRSFSYEFTRLPLIARHSQAIRV
jgi:hypothetical protein